MGGRCCAPDTALFAQQVSVLWFNIEFVETITQTGGQFEENRNICRKAHFCNVIYGSRPQFFLIRKYHRKVKVTDETTGMHLWCVLGRYELVQENSSQASCKNTSSAQAQGNTCCLTAMAWLELQSYQSTVGSTCKWLAICQSDLVEQQISALLLQDTVDCTSWDSEPVTHILPSAGHLEVPFRSKRLLSSVSAWCVFGQNTGLQRTVKREVPLLLIYSLKYSPHLCRVPIKVSAPIFFYFKFTKFHFWKIAVWEPQLCSPSPTNLTAILHVPLHSVFLSGCRRQKSLCRYVGLHVCVWG